MGGAYGAKREPGTTTPQHTSVPTVCRHAGFGVCGQRNNQSKFQGYLLNYAKKGIMMKKRTAPIRTGMLAAL